MRYPRSRGPQFQRGAALIVALLVFAVAAALMVGLQRDFTLQLQRGSNAFVNEQGWAYLRGAEALAATALRFDSKQDAARDTPRDDLSELWAQEATPYPLPEGGWLLGQLEDLQGRFNVNNLVTPLDGNGNDAGEDAGADSDPGDDGRESPGLAGAVNTGSPGGNDRLNPAQKLMIRLLQALEGVPVSQPQAIALTEAISDYIDGDDERRPDGGEDEAYRNNNPAYRPANQPLSSVSELRAVVGMTPEIYNALAPLITVWPAEGSTINIFTAPPPVLRSLNTDDQLVPLSVTDAERLVALRADNGFKDTAEFLEALSPGSEDASRLEPLLGISSEWFLLSASVQIADREMRLYSVLQRRGERIESRFRTQGEL